MEVCDGFSRHCANLHTQACMYTPCAYIHVVHCGQQGCPTAFVQCVCFTGRLMPVTAMGMCTAKHIVRSIVLYVTTKVLEKSPLLSGDSCCHHQVAAQYTLRVLLVTPPPCTRHVTLRNRKKKSRVHYYAHDTGCYLDTTATRSPMPLETQHKTPEWTVGTFAMLRTDGDDDRGQSLCCHQTLGDAALSITVQIITVTHCLG